MFIKRHLWSFHNGEFCSRKHLAIATYDEALLFMNCDELNHFVLHTYRRARFLLI